jgi:hypothetical protein
MAEYKRIPATEVGKLIRENLKAEFPGVKFGVKKTSGGSCYTIQWVDGPTSRQVDEVVSMFKGASFDGMYDLKTYNHITNEDGDQIHYGVDYIFSNRSYSAGFLKHMVDYAMATYAFTEDPQFEVIEDTYENYVTAKNSNARFGSEWARDFLVKLCWQYEAGKLPEIPAPVVKEVEQAQQIEEVAISQPITTTTQVTTTDTLRERLNSLDLVNMTPLEALLTLHELKKLVA